MFTVLVVTAALAHQPAPTVDEQFARALEPVRAAVFRLSFRRGEEEVGNGTGFAVRSDGVLATNHHVVDDVPGELVAVGKDGEMHKVLGLLADDPDHDLALVRIDASGIPALKIAESVAVGDQVALIGSPFGLDQTLGIGIVSAIRESFPPEMQKSQEKQYGRATQGPIVQHTISTSSGSSGSPIVNRAGQIVAVNHSSIRSSEVNFGAHKSLLAELLAKTDLDATPRPVGVNKRANLLISAAVFGSLLAGALVFQLVRVIRRKRQLASLRAN